MILLDTDHVTVLRYPEHPRCTALQEQLDASPEQPVVLSAVTVEEQMRGWLAEMGRRKDVFEQVIVYVD